MIECWTVKHTLFIALLVFPAIIFWLFFVPMFGLYKMAKNSEMIYQSQSMYREENLSELVKFKYKRIKSRYGFFYCGF